MPITPTLPTAQITRTVKWPQGFGVYIDDNDGSLFKIDTTKDHPGIKLMRDEPHIKVGLCRASWSWAEPTINDYKFAKFEAILDLIPTGKYVVFSFDDRNNSAAFQKTAPTIAQITAAGKMPFPPYLVQKSADYYFANRGAIGNDQQWKLFPDIGQEYFRERMIKMIEEFGKRFNGHPKLGGWMWDEVAYPGYKEELIERFPNDTASQRIARLDAGLGDFLLIMGESFYKYFPNTLHFIFANFTGGLSQTKCRQITQAYARWGHGWSAPDYYNRNGSDRGTTSNPKFSYVSWKGHNWYGQTDVYAEYGGYIKGATSALDREKAIGDQRMPVMLSMQASSHNVNYGSAPAFNRLEQGLQFMRLTGGTILVFRPSSKVATPPNYYKGPLVGTADMLRVINDNTIRPTIMPRGELTTIGAIPLKGYTLYTPSTIPAPYSVSLSGTQLSWSYSDADLSKISGFKIRVVGPAPALTVQAERSPGSAVRLRDLTELLALSAGSYEIQLTAVGTGTNPPESIAAIVPYVVGGASASITSMCVDFATTPDEVRWAFVEGTTPTTGFQFSLVKTGSPKFLASAGPTARKIVIPTAVTLPTGSVVAKLDATIPGSTAVTRSHTWTNANTGTNCSA